MAYYLGFDTSNYTTSVALYDATTNQIIQKRKLLPVKSGEKGLRQSDAVFHHVQHLRNLFLEFDLPNDIKAVGVSVRPRSVEGSYMPCFTVGHTFATGIAKTLKVPLYEFSHQEGHIAAALFSTKKLDLIGKIFLAFHVSGGTTESLLIGTSERSPITASLINSSSDVKAGQVIDRVGLMLGLDFPCGPELEKLARQSVKIYKVDIAHINGNPSLSGVENKCKKMIETGETFEDVALYCLKYIEAALKVMYENATLKYPELPVVFSGGVMSNHILQEAFAAPNSYFAVPELSSDNAAGIAILAKIVEN
ncbi:MAG: peptidase M22 [Ruminococcaceae bacterium]|nr:peptidase M22 [Oscillospiraceae bacterium]